MKINFKYLIPAFILALSITGCGGGVENENKIEPPSYEECSNNGLDGIKQTDDMVVEILSEGYYLSDYYFGERSIEYTYTNENDDTKVIRVLAQKMNPDEFLEYLPDVDTATQEVEDMTCYYLNRTANVVPEGYEISQRIQDNVEKGTTEIIYDNSTNVKRLLPLQRIYWLDENNAIAYDIEILGEYYEIDTMVGFVKAYISEAE